MPAVEVEKVECSPLRGAKVVVRVQGRRRSRRAGFESRPLLLVELGTRRHRFSPLPQPRQAAFGGAGSWSACFPVPAWLAPRLNGHMSLAVGEQIIPLPEIFVGDPPNNGGYPSVLKDGARLRAPANGLLSSRLNGSPEVGHAEPEHTDVLRENARLRKLVAHERSERAKIHAKAISLANQLAECQAQLAEPASQPELQPELAAAS